MGPYHDRAMRTTDSMLTPIQASINSGPKAVSEVGPGGRNDEPAALALHRDENTRDRVRHKEMERE
mgnify:CR=1 FL=1